MKADTSTKKTEAVTREPFPGNRDTRGPFTVTRDRQSRYLTNGATLGFINWFAARMKVPNSVIYDLGMKALYEQLEERDFPAVPPIDVGDVDLDTLLEQADPQE